VIFLTRHFPHHKLKNINPAGRLGRPGVTSVWKLSPYEVAQFSGELVQVMVNAAQNYIYEKSLSEIKNEFQQKLIRNQNPT
jgi:hypothetical protein